MRIHYIGDVARLTLNGKLIDGQFLQRPEFDLGLNRYAPEIFTGDLRLEILPLRKDAPIFFEPKARPDFGADESLVKLQSRGNRQSSRAGFTRQFLELSGRLSAGCGISRFIFFVFNLRRPA